MRSQGILSFGFRDFDFTKSSQIQAYGVQLASELPDNGVVPYEESVAYLGASFFDLVNQLGSEDAAFRKYREKGRSAFLPVESLRKIVTELDVDVVVTTNAPRAERAALIAAKSAHIPSLCINDNLWIQGGIEEVAKSRLADRICVLCDYVKDELVSKTGIDPEIVEVTGTPVFDSVKQVKWHAGDSNVPRVLLADCELPDFRAELCSHNKVSGIGSAVRAELNRLAEEGLIEVYFRPHPSQDRDYKEYLSCNISPKTEDLNKRLAETDVVVTAISTVGIEGKVMGLGLVSIEETVYSTFESYEQISLSTGVRDPSELKSAILKEYAKVMYSSTPELYQGKATQNISAIIDRLIDG